MSIAFSPQPGGLHFPLAPIIPPPSSSAQLGTPSWKASVSPERRTGPGSRWPILVPWHPVPHCPAGLLPSASPSPPLSSRAFLSPEPRGGEECPPSQAYRGVRDTKLPGGTWVTLQMDPRAPGRRGTPSLPEGGPPDTARGLGRGPGACRGRRRVWEGSCGEGRDAGMPGPAPASSPRRDRGEWPLRLRTQGRLSGRPLLGIWGGHSLLRFPAPRRFASCVQLGPCPETNTSGGRGPGLHKSFPARGRRPFVTDCVSRQRHRCPVGQTQARQG